MTWAAGRQRARSAPRRSTLKKRCATAASAPAPPCPTTRPTTKSRRRPVDPDVEGFEDEPDSTPEIDDEAAAEPIETDDDVDPADTPAAPDADLGVDFAEEEVESEAEEDDSVPFLEDEDEDFVDEEIDGLPGEDEATSTRGFSSRVRSSGQARPEKSLKKADEPRLIPRIIRHSCRRLAGPLGSGGKHLGIKPLGL